MRHTIAIGASVCVCNGNDVGRWQVPKAMQVRVSGVRVGDVSLIIVNLAVKCGERALKEVT